MQEKSPFPIIHFCQLQGVRGDSTIPRDRKRFIFTEEWHGSKTGSVFLQTVGADNEANGFAVSSEFGNLAWRVWVCEPADGVDVSDISVLSPGALARVEEFGRPSILREPIIVENGIHGCLEDGQYDQWAIQRAPYGNVYMNRDDLRFTSLWRTIFTVGDKLFGS
jgi:hypothetical protein